MGLTAAEQYALELINRARLDPLAEAARYDLDLNADLDPGTISTAAKQVLAPNAELEQAAIDHSTWMLDEDIFSHTGIHGSTPGQRIENAGYVFTGGWSWRENLAWYGKSGSVDMAAAIAIHHEGLYRSEGHRVNTFGADVREIGIGQVEGRFTSGDNTYNASMLTLKTAKSGTDVFVTGVAYTDTDTDNFYSIGEGDAGFWLRVEGTTVTTAVAGGYGVGVTRDDAVAVVVGSGSVTLASLTMDVSEGNGKLDIVTDSSGEMSLDLSVSAALVSGISDARLLGIDHLDLTGSADDNHLIGNAGRNELHGGAGHDTLSGGQGVDRLYGGSGDDYIHGGGGRRALNSSETDPINADFLSGGSGDDRLMGLSGSDVLDGGTGNDIMTGGGGRDVFVFSDGRDEITDFADNVDQITLTAANLGDPDMTVAEALSFASIVDGDTVFDFGDDDILTLRGVTDIDALGNDLLIV